MKNIYYAHAMCMYGKPEELEELAPRISKRTDLPSTVTLHIRPSLIGPRKCSAILARSRYTSSLSCCCTRRVILCGGDINADSNTRRGNNRITVLRCPQSGSGINDRFYEERKESLR